MTVTAVRKDPQSLTMTLEAEFDASPERVWQPWADPRQLECWWGPPTYPATFTRHDLAPGSRVEYHMTGPQGDQSWYVVMAPYNDPRIVVAVTIEHADAERPPRAELVLVRQVPGRAARRPKVADDVRDESGPTDERGAIGLDTRIGRRFKRRECSGNRWRAPVEQAVAAAHDGSRSAIQQERRADARRRVHLPDNAVAVQAAAVFDIPALRRLDAILREQRHVDTVHGLGRWAAVVEPARQTAV